MKFVATVVAVSALILDELNTKEALTAYILAQNAGLNALATMWLDDNAKLAGQVAGLNQVIAIMTAGKPYFPLPKPFKVVVSTITSSLSTSSVNIQSSQSEQ